MATKLFNFTNQRLNAKKLREVQSFNSGGFAGVISENFASPFSVEGNKVTLTASDDSIRTFMGGGVLLNQTSDVEFTFTQDNQLWYLQVELDDSVADITTDELIGKISFNSKICEFMSIDSNYTYYSVVSNIKSNDNPHDMYYIYSNGTYSTPDETSPVDGTVYYAKIDASRISFRASGISTSTFSYFGNTIWISDNTFIIPLFAKVGGTVVQAVVVRDLSDFESLMSLDTYEKLKLYSEGTFVWSSGGSEPVTAPDGTTHKKGDIGYLNITGDTISNNNDSGNAPVKVQNLTINNVASADNTDDTKLVIDANGNISAKRDYTQPVSFGGTGANSRGTAKQNLGIYYGTTKPSGSSLPGITPQEGDIYLWIIE